jgi:hypothetical protein
MLWRDLVRMPEGCASRAGIGKPLERPHALNCVFRLKKIRTGPLGSVSV